MQNFRNVGNGLLPRSMNDEYRKRYGGSALHVLASYNHTFVENWPDPMKNTEVENFRYQSVLVGQSAVIIS